MEEMVEPDRTILIVSIIGLVIIWGSFFYHKFVQGGGQASGDPAPAGGEGPGPTEVTETGPAAVSAAATTDASGRSGKSRRGRRGR